MPGSITSGRPPQPDRLPTARIAAQSTSRRAVCFQRVFLRFLAKRQRAPHSEIGKKELRVSGYDGTRSSGARDAFCAATVIVRIVDAWLLPGVMVGGTKEAATPEGRPDIEKVIGLL